MKIEKTEIGYKISDLYISAALLCNDAAELTGIDFVKDLEDKEHQRPTVKPEERKMLKRVLFVIKGDSEKLKEIIDDYFNNKYLVDANLFANKIKELKSRIYASY